MLDLKTKEWNESYARMENVIFYPHEEMVRFLNRFIRKRLSQNEFLDVIYQGDFYHSGVGITQNKSTQSRDLTGGGERSESLQANIPTQNQEVQKCGAEDSQKFKHLRHIQALDFGCGIGRQSVLMAEFGIQTSGIDISQNAIAQAHTLYDTLRKSQDIAPVDFRIYDGQTIPFEDESFDFSVSYGVLDSLPFSLALKLVSEIARVSKTYFFCSLIGEDSVASFQNIQGSRFTDEIQVEEAHEKGTIQSFFDMPKIQKLFQNTPFEIIWGEKKSALDLFTNQTQSRYYIVCKKNKT